MLTCKPGANVFMLWRHAFTRNPAGPVLTGQFTDPMTGAAKTVLLATQLHHGVLEVAFTCVAPPDEDLAAGRIHLRPDTQYDVALQDLAAWGAPPDEPPFYLDIGRLG